MVNVSLTLALLVAYVIIYKSRRFKISIVLPSLGSCCLTDASCSLVLFMLLLPQVKVRL